MEVKLAALEDSIRLCHLLFQLGPGVGLVDGGLVVSEACLNLCSLSSNPCCRLGEKILMQIVKLCQILNSFSRAALASSRSGIRTTTIANSTNHSATNTLLVSCTLNYAK